MQISRYLRKTPLSCQMKNLQLLIVASFVLLVSCTSNEPYLPYTYNANPIYTKGYVEFFGNEYSGYQINQNVLSVSLFSESLIDSTGEINGSGQFLRLEDVFVASTDTLLPLGTFTISNTHQPFTVLPGKNDTVGSEVFQIGAFIQYYEPIASKSIKKLITEGTFTVSIVNNKYNIVCDCKTADKKALTGVFTGILPHYDESLKVKKTVSSKVHYYLK